MRGSSKTPDVARLYTRRHLYSALRLTATVVNKRSGQARQFTATGFLLSQRVSTKRRLWLVTNRHVLDPPFNPERTGHMLESLRVEGTIVSSRGSEDRKVDFSLSSPGPVFPADPSIDVGMVALEFDGQTERLEPMAFSTTGLIGRAAIHDDDIGVGSEVVMAGYPTLDNGTSQRPLLVPGLVSSDLQHPAEYGGHTYEGRGLCHAFSRGGMSGAPVLTTVTREPWAADDDALATSAVEILGINCGHPQEKRGPEALSLFVPAWTLDAMLAEQGDLSAKLRSLSARDRTDEE